MAHNTRLNFCFIEFFANAQCVCNDCENETKRTKNEINKQNGGDVVTY